MKGKGYIAGVVLSAIAGILILVNGAINTYNTLTNFEDVLDYLKTYVLGSVPAAFWEQAGAGALALWCIVTGVIVGLLVLAFSVAAFKSWKPTLTGALIIVLSALSILSGGGFYAGYWLGIIGGILILAFKAKPSETQQ